jgi:hypothetical protein
MRASGGGSKAEKNTASADAAASAGGEGLGK